MFFKKKDTRLSDDLKNAIERITRHEQYSLESEVLFQVIGAELYAYSLARGRTHYFMDQDQIELILVDSLVKTGAARKYTTGMIEYMSSIFSKKEPHEILEPAMAQGHDAGLRGDNEFLVRTVYENTVKIESMMDK